MTLVERVQAEARVAHLVPGVFMGLEFTQIPDSTRMAIEWYVNTIPPQIMNA